jgi:translation initiation factor IF-2
MDPKRGISASLIITNGTLKKGMCISAGDATAPVRAIENSAGQNVDEASFSSPVLMSGLDKIPPAGALFYSYENRRDAEKSVEAYSQKESRERESIIGNPNAQVSLPVIIKTDVLGTHEAVVHELKKIWHEKANIRIVHAGVGDISENDVKVAAGSEHARIIGFRVGIERKARDAAERLSVPVETFSIIYNILDYIEREVAARAPKEEIEETRGEARILRIFSVMRDKQVLGGSMLSGFMPINREVKIVRRGVEIGRGTILELQQQKIKVSEVKEGEFGIMVLSRTEIATGDVLAAFEVVTK